MYYIVGVLVLCLLVFVHELGHFLAAKYFKMPVKSFSIGMGPKIFKKKWGETEYCISIIPFGGYVKIQGEEDKEIPYGFLDRPIYQRFFVLIAGPIFNFIFAIMTFAFLINVGGSPATLHQIDRMYEGAPIGEFVKGGDFLISVNGVEITPDNADNIAKILAEREEKVVDVVVLRNDEYVSFESPLYYSEEDDLHRMGVFFYETRTFTKHEDYQVNPILGPFIEFINGIDAVFEGLQKLLSGEVKIKDLSGPVGIVDLTNDIIKEDFWLFVYLVAMLNVNLGVMNLLPIPALDGGQIGFLTLEKIVGKKRWNYKYALYVNAVFMLMILTMMIYISYFDVIDLFTK